MDIPALSSAISQTQLQQQASTATLKKSLSIEKQQGEAAVALIDSAIQVAQQSNAASASRNPGGTIDVRA